MWWLATAGAWAGELDLQLSAVDFDLSAETERSVDRLLTRMHDTYESWLGVVLPPVMQVQVDLVASEATYREREAEAMGTKTGHATVGFFLPARNQAVVWRGQGDLEMRRTLVHETAHYLLVAGGLGGVPLYLHEGLAELFETSQLDGNAVWLVPNPDTVGWITSRPVPAASTLIGRSKAEWDAAANTPWGRAEYPYGWALCAFLLSTDPGRHTLADLLASTAVSRDPGADGLAAVARTYPGGADALDRDWRAFVAAPKKIQLPMSGGGGQAEGWIKCSDGSLIRAGSGFTCGRWVTGSDGQQHYVKE